MIDLSQYLRQRQAWVNEALASFLPKPMSRPALLHRAIHYSLFAGGKRLRPILTLAAFEATVNHSGNGMAMIKKAVPVASAIELIHTYSLVHDDLPAMDNDDWRRGQLTSHKMFGESVAVLVGDSLLTAAFTLLSDRRRCSSIPPGVMLQVMHELGEASGSLGMVGGQLMDIQSRGKDIGENTLYHIHTRKTGSLIRASVRIGGLLACASSNALSALTRYGEKVGLAFQILDDVLDVEGKPELMGKQLRKDQANSNATYPGVVGVRRSKAYARKLVKEAIASLSRFDQRAGPLRALARYMTEREQ